MISSTKLGGRRVELFIPFEHNGKKIEAIELSPARFGHTMRWGDGDWKSSIELLSELAGVDQAVIRDLRYPDADRVMEAFLTMLPADIRNDIAEGRIPVKREPPVADLEEGDGAAAATNGSGQTAEQGLDSLRQQVAAMQGPGAPLPPSETGFDMSDEQP